MTEAEKQAILAEQAPRVAEAQTRLQTPAPQEEMDPGLIKKIILWLRSKAGQVRAPSPEEFQAGAEASLPSAVMPKDAIEMLRARDQQFRNVNTP
jgi:hypothetical protein